MQSFMKIVRAVSEKNGSLINKNKQSKSRTPKGKRKKNNKQENEFGDKNNLETGLK